MLKSLFFISLITSVVQASDDRSSPITLNFVADVKEFLGRHEKVSVIGLFGAQDGSIRTIFRSVLSSFDGSVIFADSTADRVLNHFDKKGDPLVLLFRNFDSLESQTKLQYEGPWDFSSLKSFVFSQSLPPIVAIGSPKSGDDPSELTRISNAFRQTTVSKFIVLTHGSLGSDLSNILIEFANEFHGKLVVMHVDIDAANDIGASLLRMGGLSVTDVRDDKERPLALMVGFFINFVQSFSFLFSTKFMHTESFPGW